MADVSVERRWLEAHKGHSIGIAAAGETGATPLFGTVVNYDDVCIEVLPHGEEPSRIYYRHAIRSLYEIREQASPGE